MDNRREFLKKAAMFSGTAGLLQLLPPAIQKAMAINPAAGSTFLDAEHIVFLMQENRSFDHMFGTLQGVRGFNDPRAVTLPSNNLVWLQTNGAGDTYPPFHLDIKNTKATWMGSLPHNRQSEVDASNGGKHDNWLEATSGSSSRRNYSPGTLGFYNREDLPFYFALADAFTICDQHFCSALSGTTPNRCYFWSGTIREEQKEDSFAQVRNEDWDWSTAHWKTYPERLEEHGVSWKVYQNDVSVDSVYEDEEESWLSNFTDNPLEFFAQYNIRYSKRYINALARKALLLPQEIKALQDKMKFLPDNKKVKKAMADELKQKENELAAVKELQVKFTPENFDQLSAKEKALFEKAFTVNSGDPDYRTLETLQYDDDGIKREIKIPKGDVFHQFRKDVLAGNLPTVSWLVAPEKFSDHPSSAWFGAWYVSEAMDILTKDPEVWKKTIFVLTYDENDGYYDHVPPFGAPHPDKKETGYAAGSSMEYIKASQEFASKKVRAENVRESSIGLGYRVPMVIASPWTRGGWVNSQVFDHTSSLQFLEHFLENKTKKKITETNISQWRKNVCGNLSSVFRPYNGEVIPQPAFLQREEYVKTVHKALYKDVPKNFKKLTQQEIEQINIAPYSSPWMPKQEPGTRPSTALPYQLVVNGNYNLVTKAFDISFEARNEVFGKAAAGSPFTVYAGNYLQEKMQVLNYAAAAGEKINDTYGIENFEQGIYQLNIHGPNGFYRKFNGTANDPAIEISCTYQQNKLRSKVLTGSVEIKIVNKDRQEITVDISDNAFSSVGKTITLGAAGTKSGTAIHIFDTVKGQGWYDFSITVTENNVFEKRYAGRVETGKPGITDPVMGRVK